MCSTGNTDLAFLVCLNRPSNARLVGRTLTLLSSLNSKTLRNSPLRTHPQFALETGQIQLPVGIKYGNVARETGSVIQRGTRAPCGGGYTMRVHVESRTKVLTNAVPTAVAKQSASTTMSAIRWSLLQFD